MMRCILILAIFSVLGAAASLSAETSPRPATAEEVTLLKEAMKNTDQDTEHWAYTETTIVKDKKGRVRDETVVRFDPSRPYAEQYTPLKIDGKPPTEKQLKKYRKEGEQRGEKLAKKSAELVEKPGDHTPQLTINDSKASIDVDHPLIVQEDMERITFEIPLRAEKGGDIPVEKFEILVQVGKTARQVERALFRIREAFRMKLVAKIKSGEASIDFTVVDPGFAPVLTSMKGSVGASFMMIPVTATFANTRTEWQRVKAYDERFNVKLAPLQLLGF